MVKKSKHVNLLKKKILGILLLIISSYYLFSLLFPDNSLVLFRTFTSFINQAIGLGKYFLFAALFLEGLNLLLGHFNLSHFNNKLFGFISLSLIVLAFIHLKLIFIDQAYLLAKDGAGGGLYGYYFANNLYNYFGLQGAYLFLISLGLIAILFVTDVSFFYLTGIIFKNIYHLIRKFTSSLLKFNSKKVSFEKQETTEKAKLPQTKIESQKKVSSESFFTKNKKLKISTPNNISKQETIHFKAKPNNKHKKDKNYIIPPTHFLNENKKAYKTKYKEQIKNNIYLLQETLTNFGIQGEVIGATQGPTVTRYEIQPAPGVKVSKITNLSNDIALAFASPSVRIEAPIPGKNAIGIEVPNKEKDTVFLKEIIESKNYQKNSHILPIALGKDIGGKTIIADLIDLPHLLIAGTTGSGKSVCINSIILRLIYRFGPYMIKFGMVDPKRVELNIYNGIPHLILPIVTNTKKVDKVLSWAISEMENRFKIFAEAGVRNLTGYHDYINSIKSDDPPLPYIVIIIDELADLMLSSPAKIEDSLCRLAQMTRATGIHLIIATQRPSVDIITGSIKINFPSRIAFAVSTQVDSRTILDVNGAEKLIGHGDMLFSPINASKPIRAQGSYVSEKEIKNIVSFLKENGPSPEYQNDIINQQKGQGSQIEKQEEEDELFEDAIATIINNNQASISILQRKLRIGYTRAARLIDLMEKKGMVGPYDGRHPRKILLSKEEFRTIQNQSDSSA